MHKFVLAMMVSLTVMVAASSENGLYRTNPEENDFEYLLISPPNFFDDWCWYVRARQAAHTNLHFAVKNAAAIYAAYPFGEGRECRNAAESIHAYLRQVYSHQTVSNCLQYVVLGGAWLDAQNLNNYTPYFVTGEEMSLSNCVPGIYGFPREDWRQIPSDMFYGCLDMKGDQKYPWDANDNGKYIDQDDCANNDLWPDVCVSRITLNPHSGHGTPYNQHELITNYVTKLGRGEDKYFKGHYRYGMSVASTGSSKLRKTGDRMYYRELEFYDDMYNMFDPRHHDSLEDGEYSTRVRYYDQYSNWRPLRSVKGMMNYTWTETQPTLAAAMDDYYASDRDFGYVQAHGWAQGAAQFSAYRFAIATGLTLFNGGSGPCETGYPDYHVSSGNRKVLQYNVGDAAVTNPDGGALASVNNSRWSWAGGGGYGAMSYYMLNEMLIGFNGDRLDVGHAWLKGCHNYWPVSHGGGTHTWCLTEQFLYGDPLVRLPEVPDAWWTGGAVGVWDNATPNWTNSVDDAKTFDAARNVYFDVRTNLELKVAGEIAAMRLSIPVWREATVVTLAGTGSLKVVQAVDVAGTNATLKFDVAGGVGHSGIRFLTGSGDLIFEGTNKFYVAGVKNARRLALNGGGVTLDVDEFAAGTFPLAIDGSHEPELPLPNELRSKNIGGLRRFGALAITNSHVKLATVDAFGNDAPMTHALVDSELEIAANAYYQRGGYPEGLNATFLVDGDSAVTSSEGGLWTVKHTTTFVLGENARLALCAATANAGGEIIITNAPGIVAESNTVALANATAVAGEVTIGDGVRLVVNELPLSSVSSLAVGKGATIELPDDASGYWQIVPVSSKFSCADDVTFVLSSDPTNRLVGSASKTGSFFKEGALYRWTGQEGDWNTYFANRHPKILFGDIEGVSVVTVRVATAVSPEFAFFANMKTKYVFEPTVDDAAVIFASVYLCGPTEFKVPVGATEYVEISSATSQFASVSAPYVHVAAGAGLALAGSHWTDFQLDEGAVLVAVAGETLDWNDYTSITFPEHDEVLVDVAAIDEQLLVTGVGNAWTIPELKQLRLVQTGFEFRIQAGALGVVRGDDLCGPYELIMTGDVNWNNSKWTAASNAFTKTWAACELDWAADATVAISNWNLTVDCDVHLNSLTLNASTNDFALLPTVDSHCFEVATLDLTDCHGNTDIGIDLGAARILTEASTNGIDVIHLRGAGSGTIELSGVTLVLDHPGDWSLTAGAQGVLKVVAPQAYERFRIAKVPEDFVDSALTVVVTDAKGGVIDGFTTMVADGAFWCVPPALQAEVPAGTNELTRLEWRDVLGNAVSNVDWSASAAGFQLIGTPTSGVVIAKGGFASVWSRLSISNDVVIYGDDTLSPSVIPGGNGVLTLAGAFALKADVNAAPNLLSGAKLKLDAGTTLEIRHRSINYDARNQDWRGITGTGRIIFADGIGSWLALPNRRFADTLSVASESDIVLTEGYGISAPLALRNLSGSGRFRADWSSGNSVRPVRTVQTGVSEFAGCLHHKSDRTATLIVASDDEVASTNKALIVSGTAIEDHAMTIEKSGCVILTGSWQGPITVSGILVITNVAATNGLKVAVNAGGEIKLVDAESLPTITALPPYLAPTCPDEPNVPDEPIAIDDRVRVLTATIGSGKVNWTQLEWCDANGESVTEIDWTAVTNVTLAAAEAAGRVSFDAERFTGVAKLAGAVTVEVHKLCPFTLAADSAGAIDLRLDPEPTATCDLICLQASATDGQPSVAVSVHNRYGLEIAAAGEVEFDANARKYYLNVQNVNKPTYNSTFDISYEDSITSALWFNGSGNLTYKARPEFFVDSQDGRALLGASMDYFAMHSHNGNPTVGMDGVNAWSFNFVLKLPTNNGGIVFGWGNKDNGHGVAFARVSENVAGVYAWENGGSVRLIASAKVPFASTQYHSYAVTHDSETLSLYVDGALAQSAPLVGKYPTRGFYQWFKMYGQNGGLSNGPSTAIDDFRLYLNVCLTPTSVRKIAAQFPPWPTHPTAEVDVADLAWSNLYWSADATADESLALIAGAGSLKFATPVTVTNALAISGGTVPLKLVGEGRFNVTRGLTIASELAIDASELDGDRLATCAVANVPYGRWLLRGAFSGTVSVTALPKVPDGYSVRVEQLANLGVRLVFTAPRYALADAVGISVGDDTFSDIPITLGMHRTSPANWYPYAVWTNGITAIGGLSVVGSDGGKVDSQSPYADPTSVARYFAHTSFDGDSDDYNGKTNGLTISGLSSRFDKYRVLVYLATDTEGANFGPVTIAGRAYGGVHAGSETESVTVADFAALAWGKSRVSAATEGVNVVVSEVLDADSVSVSAQRLKNGNVYARAQIAAIEIVKVAEFHPFTGALYTADIRGDTEWNNGGGAQLANHGQWRNGSFSSICLTAQVARATLDFNTAVTAETLRVVTAADQRLRLNRSADMSIYELDLSASAGAVTLAGGVHRCGSDGENCVLAAAPRGSLDIIVDDLTTSQRLLKLAADFDCNVKDFVATVHDAQGNSPSESWSVLPVDGWLVLQRLDVARPWYSLTFENALTTAVSGSQVVSLKEEGTATYVESRGGHRALTGATPYSKDEMANVPASWTIHAVAEMPKVSNGILFGYGRQNQRGIGLLTVDADDVAVAWWDSRGKFTVINAVVTNATCQYHAYALVSTGTRVELYVDGDFKGVAEVPVNPTSPVIQIGSVYGGAVGGIVKTTTGVIDDWRLYDGVLSATAIRSLAQEFAPWPDYCTAELTAADSDWDDLEWNGEIVADRPLLLDNCGGSLAITNECLLAHALYATGKPLALNMADGGVLQANAGLTLLSGWTIDCSRLVASNLVAHADAASLYVHWLVRGAYSGGDPTLIGVPDVPDDYSLSVVTDAEKGVWLVVATRVDMAQFAMPFRGTMTAGRDWAYQEWFDSSVPARRIPASGWLVASNVTAMIDIEADAEITVPECVTAVTVTGEGTVIADGKWPNFDGLTNSAWRGTLRIANLNNCTGKAGCSFVGLGNENSSVEMDNVSGWFNGLAALGANHLGMFHDYTLKIGAGGFTMNNGNSNQGYSFAHLAGSGEFSIGKSGPTFRVIALDAADFTGRISVIGDAGVTIGAPSANAGNGKIVVEAGATANFTAGACWSTAKGLDFADDATLNLLATDNASRYTITRGELDLPEQAHLTVNGGDDVRELWYVEGGDIVHREEWREDFAIATNYAAKTVIVTAATTLSLSDEGSVALSERLLAKAPLTIDASGLNGTNLATCAVAGAPYSRWLVRGAVSGEIKVALPKVPLAYAITSEVLPAYGVRLVVTANAMARFGAICVNLYRDATLTKDAVKCGLYPVARREWADLLVKESESVVVSNVTFRLGSGVSSWKLDNAPPDAVYQQYMDDGGGRTSVIEISGIEYEQYRLIVHYSTDTQNSVFQPLVVNDVYYAATPTGATSVQYTLKGVNAVWGNTGPNHQALDPAEGVNALVTDVLTGSTVTVKAIRPSGTNARATIAAIQLVRVGVLNAAIPDSRVWMNPVTGDSQSFAYRFRGVTDAKWDELSNWQQYGEYYWQTSSVIPMVEGSNAWSPTVIDGDAIANPANRAVTMSARMEGWTPQLALFNAVTVTVSTVKKLQSSPKWFWIDATSQLRINALGSDSYDNDLSLFVANSNGIVFAKNPAKDGVTFKYYLKGAGSVAYGETLTHCTHQLCRADIQLSARGRGRLIRSKRLVAYTGSVDFTWEGMTVVAEDPLDKVTGGTLKSSISDADAVGSCAIVKRADGVYLDYVDRQLRGAVLMVR